MFNYLNRITPLKRTKSRENIIPVQKSPDFLADTYFFITSITHRQYLQRRLPCYLNGRNSDQTPFRAYL